MPNNISQDANLKTIANIPGVKTIRPSLYYKAPKSVFKYLIKFRIFTYTPPRPVQMQVVNNLNDVPIPVDTGSTHTMIVSPNWFQPCYYDLCHDHDTDRE